MGSIRPRTMTEYAQLVLRRKPLILFVFCLLLISTMLVVARIPDTYESRAVVVVSNGEVDRQIKNAQIAVASSQLTSYSNLEPIIRRHKLYSSAPNTDVAVTWLSKNIKLETKHNNSSGEPETFVVSYRNGKPEVAQKVLTDVIAVFNQSNESFSQAVAEDAAALGKDLENVNTEIAGIEEQLRRLSVDQAVSGDRRAMASRMMGELGSIRSERKAVAASTESLQDKQFALEKQIASLRQQIADQEKILKTSVPAEGARASSSYGILLVRKAELEAQLKNYSAQYTDKNPKVIQAREQLEQIQKQINDLQSGGEIPIENSTLPGASELRSLKRELNRATIELEVTQRELNRKQQQLSGLPVVGAVGGGGGGGSVEAAANTPEFERLRARLHNLLGRQGTLEQKLGLSSRGAKPIFQVVDAPTLPQSPVTPNRMMLMLVAVIAALGLALIVGFISEFKRLFLISDQRDVSYYLGAPVVGLIPETLTPTEHGRTRTLRLGRGLAFLLLGVVLVPLLFLLITNLQPFQMLANR